MDAPAPSTRELTLDEAVSLAILLQKQGHFSEAQEFYRRVLAEAPAEPRALHYAGVLAHQQGQGDAAMALIERSLALEPGHADWHSNLGIVLQARERFADAIDAYRRAIVLDPGHANAHSNLGVLLRATGRPVEAEAVYRTALRLDPAHIDAWTNLGILLNASGRGVEAAACFSKVITLQPRHRDARRLLALAHCTLGEVAEASGIFEEWLSEEPGDPVATHMLAACTGRDVPQRASDAFIERTFDSFAASFEAKLQRLSYRAPALVVGALEACGVARLERLDVLDAGCGTGLCGTLLRPFAHRLTGVDLSDGMLAQAREKQVYHALEKAELTAYLQRRTEAWDLIVSADTMVYFGRLDDVAAAAARALRPGGRLVFTLEHAVEDMPAGYRLELHGRYSHSRRYVERVLSSCGLGVSVAEAELRLEAGTPVAGLVVAATRS